MKILRLNKRWSQEQLAHMSGLNVRTIQRVEKGKSVGLETLKSLAAVFEISTDELIHAIENEKQPSQKDVDIVKAQSLRNDAHEKVKSIKYFYASSAFLIAIFLFFMLPNYNGGENLGPLIVVFISFSVLIAGHACLVFQPFGEKWEQEKVAKILSQQSNNSSSTSEH
jgi:transcriptional regulator with XRE-family HTH domain